MSPPTLESAQTLTAKQWSLLLLLMLQLQKRIKMHDGKLWSHTHMHSLELWLRAASYEANVHVLQEQGRAALDALRHFFP